MPPLRLCQVIQSPVLLASVVTLLSRSLAKCARLGISVIIFFIWLKSSSYISVQFHFLLPQQLFHLLSFFFNVCVEILRCIVLLRGMISVLYLMSVDLIDLIVRRFSLFLCSFFPCCFFSCSAMLFLCEKLGFFSLVLYRSFRSFSSTAKKFLGVFLYPLRY